MKNIEKQINFFFLEITDSNDVTITEIEIEPHVAELIPAAMLSYTTNGHGGLTMNFRLTTTIRRPEYILNQIRNEN